MTIGIRTFTENEAKNRDAWITSRMENDCDGCEEIFHPDGYSSWKPSQDCPVHGLDCEFWWTALNTELDRRWPGRWE